MCLYRQETSEKRRVIHCYHSLSLASLEAPTNLFASEWKYNFQPGQQLFRCKVRPSNGEALVLAEGIPGFNRRAGVGWLAGWQTDSVPRYYRLLAVELLACEAARYGGRLRFWRTPRALLPRWTYHRTKPEYTTLRQVSVLWKVVSHGELNNSNWRPVSDGKRMNNVYFGYNSNVG